ncbi:MAG: hypothetical protein AB8B61_02305 [Cyclobacteriaceae bacterium]
MCLFDLKQIIGVVLCLFSLNSFSQNKKEEKLLQQVGLTNSDILPSHSLGIFSARISQNFKYKAVEEITFNLGLASGNVWAVDIMTYTPKSQADRDYVSSIPIHDGHVINRTEIASDSFSYHADAVIRRFAPSIRVPVSKKSELQFTLRTFLVTEGNAPFSTLTSDGLIEWFHSNVKGGEDPFGRKKAGVNQANIRYIDKNGKGFSFKKNDFVVAGLETNYFGYASFSLPLLGEWSANMGAHMGINTTRVNPSIDLGLSQTLLKYISLNEKSFALAGLGMNLLKKNVINYGDQVELTSNDYLFSANFQAQYVRETKKGRAFALTWNYLVHTPYNKRSEIDSNISIGEKLTSHWLLGTSHLYDLIDVQTLTFSFLKKNVLSFYLQQDFRVNNNPDFQTGVSYQFRL